MDRPTDNVVVSNPIASKQVPRSERVAENAVATVPPCYAALFGPGARVPGVFETKDWDTFVAKNTEYTSRQAPQGGPFQLTSIDTHVDDSATTWFTGVWSEDPGPSTIGRYSDSKSFETAHIENVKSSQRLIDFDVYAAGGTRFYVGIWGSTAITQRLVHDVGLDEFRTSLKNLSEENWRLTRIRLYPDGASKTPHATGIFELIATNNVPAEGYDLVIMTDWDSFLSQYNNYQVERPSGMRMRLEDFQVFDDYQVGVRHYVGVYRERSGENLALFIQTWEFITDVPTALSWLMESHQVKKIVRYATQIHMPTPDWNNSFKTRLDGKVVGYCGWQIRGSTETTYSYGYARASQDWPDPSITTVQPQYTFAPSTRFDLASVSKSVTGLAVMKLVDQKRIQSIDDPFHSYVSKQIQQVPEGVKKVTIRNLLQMKSGMVVDNTLSFDNIYTFLSDYLNTQTVDEERLGLIEDYSNTNFTILQAVVNCVYFDNVASKSEAFDTFKDYYTIYASLEILGSKGMGLNTELFSPVPDPVESQALYYGAPSVKQKGFRPTQKGAVAAAGWISSVKELAKFTKGASKNTSLTDTVLIEQATYETMFREKLGWDTYEGLYGQYFYHGGAFGWEVSDGVMYGLTSCVIIFPNGAGAVLLINRCVDDGGPYAATELITAYEAQVQQTVTE